MGCTSSSAAVPQKMTLEQRQAALAEIAGNRLYQQKELLRMKALPMIEKRTSCEDLLLLAEQGLEGATARSEERRKLDKQRAEAERRWILFSSLDSINEADMTRLVQFMGAAMETVPELLRPTPNESIFALNSSSEIESANGMSVDSANDQDLPIIKISRENSKEFITALRSMSGTELIGNQVSISRENSSSSISSVESFFSIDRVVVSDQLEMSVMGASTYQIKRFGIPSGFITPVVSEQIIELYRKEGALDLKSIQKVLRLSYRALKLLPNITNIKIEQGERLTVVGDIHGQLKDLLYIINESGYPSKTNKYIFNGDFVDRGPFGVEVMIIILALFVAFPESVFMNRGNHEDFSVCCAYGFKSECCKKYDDVTFGMFVEMFNYIPVFAIVNEKVFITHGGLFHCPDVSLQDLNSIPRNEFSLKDLTLGGEATGHVPRENLQEFLKQLQRDALWSDPMDSIGCVNNPRGAGVAFGPDVVRRFLRQNSLSMVVRSHECVRTGFDLPYSGDDASLLCTVFSASNYGDGGNSAAYMVFSTTDRSFGSGTAPTKVGDTDLFYSVFYFDLSEADDDIDEAKTVVGDSPANKGLTFQSLVVAHKSQLESEFRRLDIEATGHLLAEKWAAAMTTVLKLRLSWLSMIPALVSSDAIVHEGDDVLGETFIDYKAFVRSFSLKRTENPMASEALIESLYGNHRRLGIIFEFFAGNDSGIISREKFFQGVELMNQTLPPEKRIQSAEDLLRILDISKAGEIDINNFFELFRLSGVNTTNGMGAEMSAPVNDLVHDYESSSNLDNPEEYVMQTGHVEHWAPNEIIGDQIISGVGNEFSSTVDINGVLISIDQPRQRVDGKKEPHENSKPLFDI